MLSNHFYNLKITPPVCGWQHGFWVLLLVLMVAGSTYSAQESGPAFSLQFENDVLGLDDSDQHYTNGLQLSWQSASGQVPCSLASWARRSIFFNRHFTIYSKLAVGQNLYTPEDIESSDLVIDDRPYAGWLHGDMTLIGCDETAMNVLELSLGVVGPSAGGQWLQGKFHDLIDSPDPQGWDNQLHDELALLIGFERRWRNIVDLGFWNLEIDPAPHFDVALGNVFTYGAMGANIRFGQGLAGGFGPPRLRPGPPGSRAFGRHGGLTWYFFAGIEGRVMLQNIFLDGNTFGSSHSVDKEPYVADAWFGWAVSLYQVRLAANYVMRSKEFKGQDAADHFGAVTISIGY
ncbi:MAG: lipid A deacylase LpxR family protein [bacterium]|nr:lipid A deacylase LpxR family protein [bacterium]